MAENKKIDMEGIELAGKPKTITMKLGILIAVLTFLLGIWVGFFAFSFVNRYFGSHKNVTSVAPSTIKRIPANQGKKNPGPKIVIVGGNQTSETSEAASVNKTEENNSSSTGAALEEQEITSTPKTTATETISKPIVAKNRNVSSTTNAVKKKTIGKIKKATIKSWTIQIASYRKKANAIHLLKRLSSVSIAAHIKKASTKKGVFYRVILNFKGTKNGLNYIKKKIKDKLHITPFIYDPIS